MVEEPFIIEEWKEVPYQDNLIASNTGKVAYTKTTTGKPKELKIEYTKNGYPIVRLSQDNNDIVKVHQTVVELFGDLPEDYDAKKYYVRFINEDKHNCMIDNLELKQKDMPGDRVRIKVRDALTNEVTWLDSFKEVAALTYCSINKIKKHAETKTDFKCNGYWINFK